MIDWLEMDASYRPTFITLYFEEPDASMHSHGPDSESLFFFFSNFAISFKENMSLIISPCKNLFSPALPLGWANGHSSAIFYVLCPYAFIILCVLCVDTCQCTCRSGSSSVAGLKKFKLPEAWAENWKVLKAKFW